MGCILLGNTGEMLVIESNEGIRTELTVSDPQKPYSPSIQNYGLEKGENICTNCNRAWRRDMDSWHC